MKNYRFLLGILALFLMLGLSSAVKAQNGQGCSQGSALGKAHAEVAQCIAAYQNDYDITFSAYPNESGGYTVSVYGAPHCPHGQICPLYIFLMATVETDDQCNVIYVSSPCQ